MRLKPLLVVSTVVFGLVASLLVSFGARAGRTKPPTGTLAVSELHRGMKGYGLTVFEGTQPERFDVEIIDVLKNFRPKQDLILIKTQHPRLEVAKVVAGMSGSPIYIEDRLIGAYAYGWSFGKEPVAGVTPIANMLSDLNRPLPKWIYGWPLKVPGRKRPGATAPSSAGHAYLGAPGHYDLTEHKQQIALASGFKSAASGGLALRPVSTPLLLGGLTPASVELSQDLFSALGLEPLQAGGSGGTDAAAPRRYEDGGAIGVRLISGDVNAMGLGTVTHVDGDRLVAFGHPMMQAGVTALPTAVARVLWFLASDRRSFKIGMAVRDVGAMVNDRQASIVVSHKAEAPVVPVQMTIRGMPGVQDSNWAFDVAHEKFVTPSFLSVALGSAMQATAAERQDISWTARSRLKVKGYGEIELEDYGVAIGGTPQARDFVRSNLVTAVGALLNNVWEPVLIESIKMDVQLRYSRDILRLRGVQVLDPEVEAGGRVRLRMTLAPYAGPEVHRLITVPVPERVPGGKLKLTIRPGYLVAREVPEPENVGELLRNLEDPVFPPRTVVVSYRTGAGGVSYKGQVARQLPPGALDSIRPGSTTNAPKAFASEARLVTRLSEFMIGSERASVKVNPVLR